MIDDDFTIANAPFNIGREVTVNGWVRHIRSSGKIYFIEIRDGTGEMQCVVVEGEVPANAFLHCAGIKIESAISLTGIIKEEKRAPGGYEMTVHDIDIIHTPPVEYTLSKKSHGTDFLMEHRHLWLRSRRQLAILRVRSELVRLLRQYFHENGFILIDTPILTGSIGENAGNLFETNYFDLGNAYLTQTGQLYLEAAASAFRKVFCMGPTFRAEKSKTRRHLTEFWMLEAEVAFYDTTNNMDLQEDMIRFLVENIVTTCEREFEIIGRDTTPLRKIRKPFPRITYTDAIGILKDKGFHIEWGDDIGGDEETALSKKFEEPLFICNYPAEIKAFYMKPNPNDERTVLCDDMLAPEGYGEIIGGSQRNDEYSSLHQRILDAGLDPESYGWYLDLRKFGSVPHSGFGLGIERVLSWICRLSHVREAAPFPRLINRIYP
jgi:asparaginyl-tRNA synthetase